MLNPVSPPNFVLIAGFAAARAVGLAGYATASAELDVLLRPDVDTSSARDDGVGFAGAGVCGVAGLPFRAMARRGFFKGERAALGGGEAAW